VEFLEWKFNSRLIDNMKRSSTTPSDEYEASAKRPLLQDSHSQKPWRWVRVYEYIKRGTLTDIRVTLKRVFSSSS
jgi:hypothetical protein